MTIPLPPGSTRPSSRGHRVTSAVSHISQHYPLDNREILRIVYAFYTRCARVIVYRCTPRACISRLGSAHKASPPPDHERSSAAQRSAAAFGQSVCSSAFTHAACEHSPPDERHGPPVGAAHQRHEASHRSPGCCIDAGPAPETHPPQWSETPGARRAKRFRVSHNTLHSEPYPSNRCSSPASCQGSTVANAAATGTGALIRCHSTTLAAAPATSHHRRHEAEPATSRHRRHESHTEPADACPRAPFRGGSSASSAGHRNATETIRNVLCVFA